MLVPILVKTDVRFVPRVVTAVMITVAINAAIRPYSSAVTPRLSLLNAKTRAKMVNIARFLTKPYVSGR